MKQTILQHLREEGYSAKKIKSLLQTGKVYLRGVPTADKARLVERSDIEVRPRAPRITVGRDPVIIHRDEGFVVAYKPAGYLSVRAPYRHKDPNMIGFVYSLFGSAEAVHRLDEDTSGLMLIATNVGIQQKLKKMIEDRKIERSYLAICAGCIQHPFSMDTLFQRNRGDGKRGSGEEGKRAVSHFSPIEHLHKATLIQARLETGRTHQIRIHLSEAKHAVLGDKLYAPKHIQSKSRRLALHAKELAFVHPSTGQPLRFQAPLADDLERFRRQIIASK